MFTVVRRLKISRAAHANSSSPELLWVRGQPIPREQG